MAGQMAAVWKEKQAAGLKTHFIGTDMPQTTVQAVKDGTFDATIGQDVYTMARAAAWALNEIAQGKRVPDTMSMAAIIITPENAEQFLAE